MDEKLYKSIRHQQKDVLCILPFLLGKFVAIGNLDFKVRNPWASAKIKKGIFVWTLPQIDLKEKNWLQKSNA